MIGEQNMEDAKPFWASKTLWVNVIAAAAVIAGALGLDLGLDADTQAQLAAAVVIVANIVLRLVTRQPVKLGKA
jgi:uncharacterized membrane protein